jgi:hypothetical protein
MSCKSIDAALFFTLPCFRAQPRYKNTDNSKFKSHEKCNTCLHYIKVHDKTEKLARDKIKQELCTLQVILEY